MKDPLNPAPTGLVSFPVPDAAQPDEPAGRLLVRLVVLDPRDPTESRRWEGVSGVRVQGEFNEYLVGDDRHPVPPVPMEPQSEHDIATAQQRSAHWESRHYPLLHEPDVTEDEAFLTRPYRAVLDLAEQPWYGPAGLQGSPWQCCYADLTPAGKALYDQLAGAYPDARLHLLTYVCH